MQIWDFERRYKTIEPEQVFSVWSYLHTHIDYANGMWKPEVLDYVFSHAPQTELPEPDENTVQFHPTTRHPNKKYDHQLEWYLFQR